VEIEWVASFFADTLPVDPARFGDLHPSGQSRHDHVVRRRHAASIAWQLECAQNVGGEPGAILLIIQQATFREPLVSVFTGPTVARHREVCVLRNPDDVTFTLLPEEASLALPALPR
jgi:hypothetical protein